MIRYIERRVAVFFELRVILIRSFALTYYVADARIKRRGQSKRGLGQIKRRDPSAGVKARKITLTNFGRGDAAKGRELRDLALSGDRKSEERERGWEGAEGGKEAAEVSNPLQPDWFSRESSDSA